jgi:hypothetical protein
MAGTSPATTAVSIFGHQYQTLVSPIRRQFALGTPREAHD